MSFMSGQLVSSGMCGSHWTVGLEFPGETSVARMMLFVENLYSNALINLLKQLLAVTKSRSQAIQFWVGSITGKASV